MSRLINFLDTYGSGDAADVAESTDISPQNYVVNGDFIVWNEGTLFNNPATNTFVASIFRVLYDGSSGTFAVQLDGGPLAVGAPNGLRWNQSVAGAGDTFRLLEQRIEDASLLNGQKGVLTFYAGAAAPITITVVVVQSFGSGGAPSPDVIVSQTALTLTTQLQQYSIPMSFPVTSGKTFGSNFDDSIKVQFYLPNNAVFDFSLHQLRLQQGNRSFPWTYTPQYITWSQLERYIQFARVSLGDVAAAGNAFIYVPVPFKTQMRRAPTITITPGARTNNLAGTPAVEAAFAYGATYYLASNAAGAFSALGEILKLDARI